MSHLRLLMCRVDEADETTMTALAHVDLPAARAEIGVTLDMVEAQAAAVGQRLLGRLVALQWEEIEAQAVARDRTRHAPGRVAAAG